MSRPLPIQAAPELPLPDTIARLLNRSRIVMSNAANCDPDEPLPATARGTMKRLCDDISHALAERAAA